jgi:hypothetical protein
MTPNARPDFDEETAIKQAIAEQGQEWPLAWRIVGYALRAAWWALLLFTP